MEKSISINKVKYEGYLEMTPYSVGHGDNERGTTWIILTFGEIPMPFCFPQQSDIDLPWYRKDSNCN